MTNISKNLIVSCLFLALGLAITWETFDYSPNSAVFLRSMSTLLTCMALAYLVTNLVRRKKLDINLEKKQSESFSRHGTALLIFGLVAGYVAAMQVAGFLLSTILFSYITQAAIARRHRNLYVVYAALMSITIFFLFFNLLGIAVPESLLSLDQSFKFL